MLDELQQATVGVLGVVDHQHDGLLAPTDPLQEGRPRREQVLARVGADGCGAEQCGQPRAKPGALVRVGHDALQAGVEQLLRAGLAIVVVIWPDSSEPSADRLGQGVERDTLAVREASPAVPAHGCLEPVDVLLELPRETGLADSRVAVDDHERGPPGVLGDVEELLDQAQLAFPADQRCLQTVGTLGTPARGHDRTDRPERQRVGLALELVAAHVDVGDRRGGEQPGRLVDPDLAGLGYPLDPGRGVDSVTGHHAFVGCADGDRHLAGDDADPDGQAGQADVLTQGRHAVDQLEPGTNRPLGVVLVCGGHAPHRHHRVADELLDRAAVPRDDLTTLLEVAGQQLTDLLLVAVLREGGEPDEVAEHHTGHATAGHGRGRDLTGRRAALRSAAPAAEAGTRHQLGPTYRALSGSERGAAAEAEPSALGLLDAARRAGAGHAALTVIEHSPADIPSERGWHYPTPDRCCRGATEHAIAHRTGKTPAHCRTD